MKRLITLLVITIVLSFLYSCNIETSESNKENILLQEESKLIVKSLKDKIYINISTITSVCPVLH